MKYIVHVINYPTLCRALRYIDTQWGKENTTIIYSSDIAPLPEAVAQEYNAISAPYYRSVFPFLRRFSVPFSLAHNSWKIFNKILSGSDEECTLVVFRDNGPDGATLIERAFRRYPNRVKLWIIEEGSGIYGTGGRSHLKHVAPKRIIYALCGISQYALKMVPQGMHPRIEKVICQHPHLVAEKFADKIVEQQIDIFVPEFNKRFASYVLGTNADEGRHYDFVFLTTPVTDDFALNDAFIQKYDAFLHNLFTATAACGKLLVKCHPRDIYNYEKFKSYENVTFCTDLENKIPFECLFDYCGRPQIISFGSSAVLGLSATKPTLIIREILGLKPIDMSIWNRGEEHTVISCRNWEEFDNAISGK